MVIIVAASFNIPGGRFLSSLKTSSSETELKTKCSGDVVSRELTGLITPDKIAKRKTLGLQNTRCSGKEVTKALGNGGCV